MEPPLISAREEPGVEESKVLETDEKLKDFDDSKWLFTDITKQKDDKVGVYNNV